MLHSPLDITLYSFVLIFIFMQTTPTYVPVIPEITIAALPLSLTALITLSAGCPAEDEQR